MLFLGSYPPRNADRDVHQGCGRQLRPAFRGHSEIIAIESGRAAARVPADRRRELDPGRSRFVSRDRDIVNHHPCDALNVQHEFGLFGGDNGEWIVDLIALVRKPVTVSLHTVLPDPTPDHLRVVRTICATATAVVVLSATGKDILIERYGIDPHKVNVIHHGVPTFRSQHRCRQDELGCTTAKSCRRSV